MGGFCDLLQKVKAGSSIDFERLTFIYRVMLIHHSIVYGKYDEDLHQELLLTLYNAAHYFEIDKFK